MTERRAIQLFRSRGMIPPGHQDTIARYIRETQNDGRNWRTQRRYRTGPWV